MSRWMKVALVCAGYLLAVVAGCVASYLYDARVSALPYDTSGGMYAGGQLLSGLAAFLVVALIQMRGRRAIKPRVDDLLEIGAGQTAIKKLGENQVSASNE